MKLKTIYLIAVLWVSSLLIYAQDFSVYVSNFPLYFLCERLAPEDVETLWLFPEGEDPAFWNPGREDLKEIQEADILLLNGGGYDKWLDYVFLDPLLIEDSSAAFQERYLDSNLSVQSHSHGSGPEHGHGDLAFTFWLDLELYMLQADAAAKALVQLIPDQSSEIEKNLMDLKTEIEALHLQFQDAGRPYKDKILLASHPVYQYFSQAYLGEVNAVLWEPDHYPEEEEWATLLMMKEKWDASIMLWEDEPLEESRKRLEEMGIRILIISPAFSKESDKGDYLERVKLNLEQLKQGGNF